MGWVEAVHAIQNTRDKAYLVTGPIGFMFVASMVLCQVHEEREKFRMAFDISVDGIIQLHNDCSRPCEFLYGAAGGLYCIRFLRGIPFQNDSKMTSLLNDLEAQLVEKILGEYQHGLGWPWHGEIYIGAAHGTTGILLQLHWSIRFDCFRVGSELIYTEKYSHGGNYKSHASSRSDCLVRWCCSRRP